MRFPGGPDLSRLGFIHDIFQARAVVQVNAWPKAAAAECGSLLKQSFIDPDGHAHAIMMIVS